MRKVQYLLSDSFSVTGQWWLPGNPDVKVYGTLQYSEDDIVLTLSGRFDSIPLAGVIAGSSTFKDRDVIHGIGDNCERYTLFNSFLFESGESTKYSSRCMFIGMHTADAGSIRIKAFAFSCDQLENFLVWNVLEEKRTKNPDESLKEISLLYHHPEKIVLRIESLAATLEIGTTPLLTSTPMSQSINVRAYIEIRPDCPQNINWHLRQTWSLCYLLTLLTNEKVSPTSLSATIEGDPYSRWFLIHSERDNKVSKAGPVLLFHYEHIADNAAAIIDKWFSESEIFGDATHLTMLTLRDRGAFHRSHFTHVAQALEAFSRATTTGTYMPAADYKNVKQVINQSIPASVVDGHRESILSKIRYGNELSLRTRIKRLIASLQPEAIETFCVNQSKFVSDIVETRNYLAHYTDELRDKALKDDKLYWAFQRVLILLRILFLKHLGIEEALIVRRINQDHSLHQRITIARKLEKKSLEEEMSSVSTPITEI